MARLNYFVIAEDVIKSDDDGSITIVKIFNRLFAERVPFINPPVALAFGFSPEKADIKDDEVKFKLNMIEPSGQTILQLNGVAHRRTPKPGNEEYEITSFIKFDKNLVLREFGFYKINLMCGSKKVAENEFELVKKAKEQE